MPYALPADPSSSTSAATPTTARPGHRRTRSSFSDERGPGAFTSLGSLPRRRPGSETGKRALFHLSVDDDSPGDDDGSPVTSPRAPAAPLAPPLNSLRLSIEHGRFSPTVSPPSHIELPPKVSLTHPSPPSTSPSPGATSNVPFPTSSPLSPTDPRSPFLPDTPSLSRHSLSTSGSSSIPRTPSTPIILSNGRPLKPSLKSSSSSPNVVADFALARKHSRAQSAPSTPRVHFAEKDADLATVRVFSRSGKPASLSKPAGEETETETEAEYPFPPTLAPGSFGAAMAGSSGVSSPSQLLHEVDSSPRVTSPIPNPAPAAGANIFLETVTLPRTRPPTLRGTVLVRNVHFEKSVVVRFTLDDWQTTSEVGCRHVVSLPGLPPPFPRQRTMGDVAGQIAEAEEMQWDRFSFTIRLEDYEAKLSERTLFLVARYVPCNGAMGEFWDNNGGRNYRVGFRRVHAPASPLASPLSTPRPASLSSSPRMVASASFPAGRKAAGFALPAVSTFGASRWSGATSQQRTFSAPSSLKVTPVTGQPAVLARVAGDLPQDVSVPEKGTPPEEKEEEEEGEARVPLFRRHSAPHEPRFPVPPPIATTQHTREPAGSSPVQAYIKRRLSLSNYVAPGQKSASSSPVVETKPVEGKKVEEEKKGFVALTPPSTPPRDAHLKGLPDVAKDDAQAMLSPLLIDEEETPFSPAKERRAWGSLQALSQLVSPPVSREGSAENSGAPTPVRSPSPSLPSTSTTTSSTTTSFPQTTEADKTEEEEEEDAKSPVNLPSPTPGGAKVDTSDSSYAAFIRQWCFAQSTPPSGPSPAATPSPSPFGSGSGSSFGGSSGGGVGSMGGGAGVGPRRQQAWPVEQYGFPGFGFATQTYPPREAVVGAQH